MAFNDYAQTEKEIIRSKGSWMGGKWRGGYNINRAIAGQEQMARILDQGFNGVVRPGRGTNLMVKSAVNNALAVQEAVANNPAPSVISRSQQRASQRAYMNERVSTTAGNPGFRRGTKTVDVASELMEQHGLDRESAEAMLYARKNTAPASTVRQEAQRASIANKTIRDQITGGQFGGNVGKFGATPFTKFTSPKQAGAMAEVADRVGVHRPMVDGLGNKLMSSAGSIWKRTHLINGINGNLVKGMAGMGAGLAIGVAGNLLAPNLANTDDHFVRNAMGVGAAAGALSILPRAIVGARTINPNIPKWAVQGAQRITKTMEHNKTIGLAFAAAGLMGGLETHFTRAMNGNN